MNPVFRPLPLLALLLAWASWPADARAEPSGDPKAGAVVAEKCLACHTLEEGGKKKYGPNLFGIVGKSVGAEPEYRYGPYLREVQAEGALWTEASLRDWLSESKTLAKAADSRTKMPDQELEGQELDDLMSFLRTLK